MIGPYTGKESATDKRRNQMPLPAMLAALGPMLAKAGPAIMGGMKAAGPAMMSGMKAAAPNAMMSMIGNPMLSRLGQANDPLMQAAGVQPPGFGAYAGASLGGGVRGLLQGGLQAMMNRGG